MALLIDGYNLMHAATIVGRGRGPGRKSLERSRMALLTFLAESLPAEMAAETVVVFDARHAPPGLPRIVKHCGITVQFAPSHDDADALLEELIERDTSPRKLTVVSSDHRLHRAAKRRRAQPVDSDRWFAEALRDRFARKHAKPAETDTRTTGPLSSSEVAYWLRTFGISDELSVERESDAREETQASDSQASTECGGAIKVAQESVPDEVKQSPAAKPGRSKPDGSKLGRSKTQRTRTERAKPDGSQPERAKAVPVKPQRSKPLPPKLPRAKRGKRSKSRKPPIEDLPLEQLPLDDRIGGIFPSDYCDDLEIE